MSTPPDLGEELVNSLSEGGGGVGVGGEMGWRVCCLQATLAWEEGWEETGPSLARLAKPPPGLTGWRRSSVLGSTLRLPKEQSRCGPLSEVGFPKLPKGFQPHSVPLSGPCFPTVEEIQGHPKGLCPAKTLYTTVSEPEAQRGS